MRKGTKSLSANMVDAHTPKPACTNIYIHKCTPAPTNTPTNTSHPFNTHTHPPAQHSLEGEKSELEDGWAALRSPVVS